MSVRKAFMATVVVLCSGRLAFPQINGIEVAAGATAQVFGGKRPVVVVKDAAGEVVASIPIEAKPGGARFRDFRIRST